MALLLRKACQETLDKADLSNLFADIDDNSKQLQLYTLCGKRFAFVHGVKFGRLQVTQAEIDFAVELLETWLTRNREKIDNYLDALEVVQRIGEVKPAIIVDGCRVEVTTTSHYEKDPLSGFHRNVHRASGITVLDKKGTYFAFNNKGEITGITFKKAVPTPWAKAAVLPKKILDTAMDHLELLLLQRTKKEVVTNVLAELNACEC